MTELMRCLPVVSKGVTVKGTRSYIMDKQKSKLPAHIPITGVLTPSALSKLTMLATSRRLFAPREVDLSLSFALISVFLLLA